MTIDHIDYIITHPGRAHRDEFYAIGLAIHIFGPTAVYRREPTEEELDEPHIMVLDVGKRQEPWLNNFDHHQLTRGTVECTLSLMAKYFRVDAEVSKMTYHDLWQDAAWYRAVMLQDSLGPAGMAKRLGVNKMPEEFMSGIEIFCLQQFAADKLAGASDGAVAPYWLVFCLDLVEAKIRTAQDFIKQMKRIKANHEVRPIRWAGVPWKRAINVFWAPKAGIFGINAFIKKKKFQIDITITKDPRTGGLSVYRLREDGPFDFAHLTGAENVIYADHRGFLATLEKDTPWERIEALIVLAYDESRFKK
jgi:hypothetical protein